MPLSAIDWPAKLAALVEGIQVIPGHDGKGCCRIDVDVNAETLFLLNEFEAHSRHRQVRIWLPEGSGCLRGGMNTIIGLGSPADPARHISRVRISFHDVTADDCSDDPS